MVSVLISRIENQKVIENRTTVYFCLHHEFVIFFKFWGMFAALRPSFYFFLLQFFVMGSEGCLEYDVIHTVILALRKINI